MVKATLTLTPGGVSKPNLCLLV